MNSSDRLRPEDLLGHVEWAKALARRLVRDDSTADDVAQEALAVALERPPTTDRPVRPWLGRVLQNAVRQRARGERRRDRREHAAAPKEALPSVHELTERAEAQGLLVEALLGLDEATRRVVLLRYFEGHSAAEIARALDEPAGTVRSRLSRGLAQLRERLDERFGGDRSAWHAALAPLVSLRAVPAAGVSLAALLAVPLAMKLFTAVALLAVLCLAVLMAGGPGVLPGRAPVLERVTFTAMEPVVLASGSLELPGGRAPAAGPPAETAAPVAPDEASVAIELRFVDRQGTPIDGVETRLLGRHPRDKRSRRPGPIHREGWKARERADPGDAGRVRER